MSEDVSKAYTYMTSENKRIMMRAGSEYLVRRRENYKGNYMR